MKNAFLKIGIFLIVVIFGGAFFVVESASADATHNIRGLAYNGSYGYISFNCLDDDFGARFPMSFPFTFYIGPCTVRQSGVNLDENNNFSGEAWNSILGIITFSSALTPPTEHFRSYCNNNGTCLAANNCTACYNEDDGRVYGYMQVVSTGEWIRLDSELINPSTQISNYLSPQPGIFSGYATSTLGEISFNCADAGVCGTNSYYVRIGPLEIRQLQSPHWSASEACSLAANRAVLKWNRRSGTQTAYQILVSTQDSTSTGVVINTGKVSSAAYQHNISGLSYNQPYYWFLRLWDGQDVPTLWRQFNTDVPNRLVQDWLTHNQSQNFSSKTFTTYKHEYPRPLFSWFPEEILIATTSNSFISQSQVASVGAPTTRQDCSAGTCNYEWTTSDYLAVITSPTSASTSIEFAVASSTAVNLRVTDTSGYSCATSTTLNVNYQLPLWKEIKASQDNP
jgi:hypothetical protein